MNDQPNNGVTVAHDARRRKLEGDAEDNPQSKGDRTKVAVDKAKANYLSGQLRLRLQYAKLKVEHGWQKQSLSEVENLYFRHTHLTRPYPVISPGGRRTGRTLPSSSLIASNSQHHPISVTSSSSAEILSSHDNLGKPLATGSVMHANASLGSTSSSSSIDSANTTVPSTPHLDSRHHTTPHAPHLGFGGSGITRYPISRSDSTATVIVDSSPRVVPHHPLHHTKHESVNPHHPSSATLSSSKPSSQSPAPTTSPFREPFDPMEPTQHIDSQLAALRSMINTSAMPVPLPPRAPGASPLSSGAGSNGPGPGLTYDAFWSSHSSATSSYRSLRATPTTASGTGPGHNAVPLQAYASAPAAFAPGVTRLPPETGGASSRT
ncbi:hypothetical protein C8Q79DRAFT_1012070 [Trametes meyenii]|nr:hypothetical protein C8Q79DRAFT_1012070 [Trametes meyenii]